MITYPTVQRRQATGRPPVRELRAVRTPGAQPFHYGGDVPSTRTRLLLFDVRNEEVIYPSEAQDFEGFAGFVARPSEAAVSVTSR